MTQADKKIRNLWLISFLFVWVYSAIMTFRTPMSGAGPFFYLFTIGTCALIFWAFYHCAYKRPGTKLITLYLISLALGILFNLFVLVFGMPAFLQAPATPQVLSPGMVLFSTASSCWMFFITWKLRKANKTLQKETK